MKKRKNPQIVPNPKTLTLNQPLFHAPKDPKTSEYAFFKKLKKDSTLRFGSRKDSSKKLQPSDCSRGKTGDVKVNSEGDNSSRIIEDEPTFRTDSFLSPSDGAWKKSGLFSVRNTPKISQGCGDNFKPQHIFSSHEGNKYVHGEVFSRKRQKLRQCASDALFTAPEELYSKGHDVISMLLSRLFPVNIKENKYEDTNPGDVVNATRYALPDSQESDVQYKEPCPIPKRKLLELESTPYFSDRVLSPMFLRSDERIIPHDEFPTYHSLNFQPSIESECKLNEPTSFSATGITIGSLFNEAANATRYVSLDSQDLDVQFTKHNQMPERKLLELESNSYFSDHMLSPMHLRSLEIITPHATFPTHPHKFLPVLSATEAKIEFGGTSGLIDNSDLTQDFLCNEQKHETFTLNHFKERGQHERKLIPPLLEEDFDCTTDEISLPITCEYTKLDRPPELSIVDHGVERILNNALDEYHFSPSSSLLNMPEDFNSILDSGLLRYREFWFGKYVYENMETNFNHTALSLSHNKHYFESSESLKNDTSCVQDSARLSSLQNWGRRSVFNDCHHYPDSEAWLPSSLDEFQRFLSLTSSHPKFQTSKSRNLQLCERESISSLFHISECDNYTTEIDDENHREMLYHFRKGLIEICNSSFLRMSLQRDHGCPFPLDDTNHVNEQEQTQKMLL